MRRQAYYFARSKQTLFVLHVLLQLTSHYSQITDACYKYPPDIKDLCEEKQCQFGAQCKRSMDGRKAECVCPTTCATFGDNRGSRPICGSNNKDYANICELRRDACREMKEVTVKYAGKCGMLIRKNWINCERLAMHHYSFSPLI